VSARSERPAAFLTPEETARVEAAIASAERRTSGEIRVVISRRAKGDPLDAARKTFDRLRMHETADRNGVLVFLAVSEHRFAILGDEGIHRHVGADGWNRVRDEMAERFASDDFGGGLVHAIEAVGRVLSEHFPRREGDVDELADQVVEE